MILLILSSVVILTALCAERLSSLEARVAQMIIIGFPGDDYNSEQSISEFYEPGGVILYNRSSHPEMGNITSPEQLLKLTQTLNRQFTIPPFIAVDQEGGKVIRLKPEQGFRGSVSAKEIGRKNQKAITVNWADNIADELHRYGINLNLAPVVDLEINSSSPGIGQYDRCFDQSPEKVVDHARIFCRSMNNYMIFNCLKHFPGHGSVSKDPHFYRTDISRSWEKDELKPFKQLISENAVDMIMTGHLFHKTLDNDHPASLSRDIIHSLLRTQMGWQGVVITDDLQMKAVNNQYSFDEILKLAILAGNDLLLVGNSDPSQFLTLDRIVNTIAEMVYSGEIPVSIIDRSCQRIRQLKAKFIDIKNTNTDFIQRER